MKSFTIIVEAAVMDHDEDVIRIIPRAITQRFEGTAVVIKSVTINREGEDK